MKQIAEENKQMTGDGNEQTEAQPKPEPKADTSYSFYSEDSYELCRGIELGDPAKRRKRPDVIPRLDLAELPDYESTSEDEDEQEEKEPQEHEQTGTFNTDVDKTKGEGTEANLDASANVRVSMNEQDYRQSMQYIDNYYQKQ